jgi:FkbM family methyltransferase
MVIDLNSRRKLPVSCTSLTHPAGVTLPFESARDADLILPEIRNRIVTGAYSAELLRMLRESVRPADRVLVIGAGLGTVSTLAARSAGVQRVIAVEPNTELCPYLTRTHELNGVPWVETINAVLVTGMRGRVPFFARHDLRLSSLLPDECSWQLAMMVVCMDLNLILAEERISLLVCEVPSGAASILADADLSRVDRVLVGSGDDTLTLAEMGEVVRLLAGKGFAAEAGTATMRFARSALDGTARLRATDSA